MERLRKCDIHAIADIAKLSPDELGIPTISNFPAVDAVQQPDVLFQMKRGRGDGFNLQKLGCVVQKMTKEEGPIRLYVVVPESAILRQCMLPYKVNNKNATKDDLQNARPWLSRVEQWAFGILLDDDRDRRDTPAKEGKNEAGNKKKNEEKEEEKEKKPQTKRGAKRKAPPATKGKAGTPTKKGMTAKKAKSEEEQEEGDEIPAVGDENEVEGDEENH